MDAHRNRLLLVWLALALLLGACVGGFDASAPAAATDPPAVCGLGTRDCPCDEDQTCEAHLACEAGVCRETRGFAGGPCFANSTCDPGLLCEDDTCVECTPGSPGCSCDAAQECEGELACTNGRCVVLQSLMEQRRPAVPVCYTPCDDDWVDEESFEIRTCSNGLLAGCLPGQDCVDGSCVKPNESPLACAGDVDCPAHQVCVGGGATPSGRCYSNCDVNADCDVGMICSMHACRQACDTQHTNCGQGMECKLLDTSTGACLPVRAREPSPPTARAVGDFSVSEEPLRFSNIDLVKTVTIHNGANRPLDFIVRKRQQRTDGKPGDVPTPLPFLSFTVPGTPPVTTSATETTVRIGVEQDVVVSVSVAATSPLMPPVWDGLLEVEQRDLGFRRVAMSFTQKVDSRFLGQVHYFADFSDANLEAWRNRRSSSALLWGVRNAFVQKWGAFRSGGLATVAELDALIAATVSGSWSWPNTRAACSSAACYLFDEGNGLDRAGVRTYTTDLAGAPIPGGVTSLPIALDLQLLGPKSLVGRIASEESLQYPGSPAISLEFDNDVASCLAGRSNACLSTVKRMSATITLGGRQPKPDATTACQNGFLPSSAPWLLADFTVGTTYDQPTQTRHLVECRDDQQPFPGWLSNASALNRALAGANPIPDGRVRQRTIELVDGYLIDKDRLYLLFREKFEPGFLGAGGPSFYVYGLMTLRRTPAQLPPNAFVGYTRSETRTNLGTSPEAELRCDAGLVQQLLGPGATPSDANAEKLASGLVSGIALGTTPPDPYPAGEVHWLCDDGRFDSPCPAGHDVNYFVGDGLAAPLSGESCNGQNACGQQLEAWRAPRHVRDRVPFRCDDNGAYCDLDRSNLKAHKVFFKEAAAITVLLPLRAQVDRAFRYATQFRSRSGETRVGFKPDICETSARTLVPYCYDPAEIERTQARVDCLIATLKDFGAPRPDGTRPISDATLRQAESYLAYDFGYEEEQRVLAEPLRHDGFEHMYAELLVMLGDESYTRAFRSRFDLAGLLGGDFPGDKLEVNGLRLSGGLGLEMRTLYQATQYYQMVLDRYYRLVPGIWRSLSGIGPQFVTQRTVTSYFAHLQRASSQKARAFGEIAKRYQILNRPDLARAVVERAYAATYLESLSFGRMMRVLVEQATPEDMDQIRLELKKATAVYGQALLEMRRQYESITDTVTMFGYSPDYVPLPVPTADADIFMRAYNDARESLRLAEAAEVEALADHRTFETDKQEFQNTLNRIRTTYNQRLQDICGSMPGDDGNVYPAIVRYASLNKRASALGDPCGAMNGGKLQEQKVRIDEARLYTMQVVQGYTKIKAKIDSELLRMDELCGTNGVITNYANVVFDDVLGQHSLEAKMAQAKQNMDLIVRTADNIRRGMDFMYCNKGTTSDCEKLGLNIAWVAVTAAAEIGITGLEIQINQTASQLAAMQADSAKLKILQECKVAQVSSHATVRDLALEYTDLDLQALKADYQMRVEVSQLGHLHDEAVSIMAEQEEAEQMAINLEAAHNDPNVRIYKNDAILTADRTFADAIAKVYVATKVFEFLSGQSYADLGSLMLIRMVKSGSVNLNAYIAALKNRYDAFIQRHRLPESGVVIVSLMNDVLKIPRIGVDKRALPVGERQRLFRVALAGPELINRDGLLELPFATLRRNIPPLARMAKIEHIELEITGTNVGDAQGHIQVVQQGTSTLSRLERGEESQWFLRMDPQQALANLFFNGFRAHAVASPDFYKNRQLGERPLINGDWKLILDQRDDLDNRDIELSSLTDVKIYIYYKYFTPQ